MPARSTPTEPQVVAWLKQALLRDGLVDRPVRQVVVDADGSYARSRFKSMLEPMGTVRIGGRRPDLVCVVDTDPAERLAAFEVKGAGDYDRGLVQAANYRLGVHESYLCVPDLNGATLDAVRGHARELGVGVLRASDRALLLDVAPAALKPDPQVALVTHRYLLGESTVRALSLNKPLHYAAATVASATCADPARELEQTWGLGASAVQGAIRGAATLGLVDGNGATLRGRIFAALLRECGFSLTDSRRYTRLRLADHAPQLAAALRTMLLETPAVELIMDTLVFANGGPISIVELAQRALRRDEGMARAVFGEPPERGQPRQMRPTTRFQLKAAMYDVGLIDSRLAKGAGGGPGGYEPMADQWESDLARQERHTRT